MPNRKSSDPEFLAAWLPELVHPAAGNPKHRHKRNPEVTRLQLAVVDQIRNRFQEAVATGNLVAWPPGEIGELAHWPLLPLWQQGLGLVELRPYPDLDAFAAVSRREFAGLVSGLRIDKVRISQGQAVQALFAARSLAVWGRSVSKRYYYRFPVIVPPAWRVEQFFFLLRDKMCGAGSPLAGFAFR